ncbi:outer membrane lipoprotein LolB [Thermomonas paludicola]|uniref:outer membrane lipoprotein LolB n=1 Tax=Thermomonas paludicola TaxID=2884874 RepID=UPI00211429DE|nr:outer membrane lipoprotein LolB [Thermomonas paludicola]
MKRLVCAALAVLLAGCQTLAPGTEPAPAADAEVATAAQRLRADALGLASGDCMAPAWSMDGRVALSNGKQGGSGRIEWLQGAGSVHLQLSAPVTRQGWVLDADSQGAVLHGLPEGPRRDMDAARLLRDATGWDIPISALGCWLRAAAADIARFGPARVEYGADLLPRRIAQAGWVIAFDGWKPGPAASIPMPSRIDAQRGSDRVRLIVDRWGEE